MTRRVTLNSEGAITVVGVVILGLSGCSGHHDSPYGTPDSARQSGLSFEEQLALDMGASTAVEPIREVTPEEQNVAVQACLEDGGWPAELNSEDQISIFVPLDQEEALNQALARCSLQYPLQERYQRPMTTAQYEMQYDHWVNVTIPCLVDKGYHPEEPPGRATYVELSMQDVPSYSVRQGVDLDVLDDVDADRWPSAKEFWTTVCPEYPDPGVLYGPPN